MRGRTAAIKTVDGKSLLPHPEADQGKAYNEAHLAPGSHRIEAIRRFAVSMLIVPKGYVDASARLTLKMERGQVYDLHAGRTIGRNFRVFFWIEDAKTGEVVVGTKLK